MLVEVLRLAMVKSSCFVRRHHLAKLTSLTGLLLTIVYDIDLIADNYAGVGFLLWWHQ